jgi:hypothetical protein
LGAVERTRVHLRYRCGVTDSPQALALAVRPLALAWIDAAVAALQGFLRASLVGDAPDPLVDAAFRTAFSGPATSLGAVVVATRLGQARGILVDDARYHATDDDASLALFPPGSALPPAYAIYGKGMTFTSAFARFGPCCRAAMLLHESIHVFDPESGLLENHISEWDEPRFSAQSLDASLHNPSAYVCFATQVHERALSWPVAMRYGAGRPND